jgi:mannose-6-phosphate isomerase-like protein (cupin superfamily)
MTSPKMVTRESSSQYRIVDLRVTGLVVSETCLGIGKQTNGHSHRNEEIYYIVSGQGMLRRDTESTVLISRSIIIIKPDEYHQVINTGEKELIFLTIWKEEK